MRRPYCPVCCSSLYQVDFDGDDYKTVLGYPCKHSLPKETIESILDFIDSVDYPTDKTRSIRETYYWLYNAINPYTKPGLPTI